MKGIGPIGFIIIFLTVTLMSGSCFVDLDEKGKSLFCSEVARTEASEIFECTMGGGRVCIIAERRSVYGGPSIWCFDE